MEKAEYVFELNPLNPQLLLEQVSQALEKRTELVSRAKYPGLWKVTDYFNRKRKASEAEKKRHRIFMRVCGIINLVLGIVVLIPGLMTPKELPLLIVVGIVAIFAGIIGVSQGAKKKAKNHFLRPAELLLQGKDSLEKGRAQLLFFANGLGAQVTGSDCEIISYTECEYLIEARDIFLLTFQGRAMLFQKEDIVDGQIEEYRAFISAKIRYAAV